MMCDEEERPGYISQNEDQERVREDIEEMLDEIYKETPELCGSAKRQSTDPSLPTEDQPLIFPGRYVTRVDCVFPLEVRKRFVRRHLTGEGSEPPSAELIVRKLFGIEKLGNLLLLITPTAIASRRIEKYILHCYAVDTQWHLGVTSLIGSERDLIRDAEDPDVFSVIFCTSYIELEDAFMPTSIRSQLFDVLRKRSINTTDIWYKGKKMTLQYWSSNPQRYQKEIVYDQQAMSYGLMQGKRAVAGSDRMSSKQLNSPPVRSKQRKRIGATSQARQTITTSNAALRQHNRETPKFNEVPKAHRSPMKQHVQNSLTKFQRKPVPSSNQSSRCLNQQFTHTPNPTRDLLDISKKSKSLQQREREWVKFVGSSIQRRQIPMRRKRKSDSIRSVQYNTTNAMHEQKTQQTNK